MKCRAETVYISKRSKPTHGAEIKETQFAPQATTNYPPTPAPTYWQMFLLPHSTPESHVPVIPHGHSSKTATLLISYNYDDRTRHSSLKEVVF